MADKPAQSDMADLPQARVAEKRRSMFSLVWIVPLLAVLIGVWLAWRAYSQTGPAFTIVFATAEGIEAGKTKIKYKSVDVGVVEAINLAPDQSRVVVHARMEKHAEGLLVADSHFWVVRPRVAGGNVEGLGTLISGSYVGMDVGIAKTEQREFIGLEDPPIVSRDVPGRHFVLKAESAASITVGSPVFFRRVKVGEVESFRLEHDGDGVRYRIFVQAPYDQYVTDHTRFWEASGIDIKLSATGLEVNTESLAAIAIGGIAFQTRQDAPATQPAGEDARFRLFARRDAALARAELSVVPMQMRFKESVRGLTVGAPVDFRGVTIGEVTNIRLDIPEDRSQLVMVVLVDIFPDRLQRGRIPTSKEDSKPFSEGAQLLVKNGVRAQLKTGSLLTGQLYVALDFYSGAKPAVVKWDARPPEFPTVPGTFVGVEENVMAISNKLAKVPFDAIGQDLRASLVTLNRTLDTVSRLATTMDRDVSQEIRKAIADMRQTLTGVDRNLEESAPLKQDVREAMREIARAAASLRHLTDYLEQHPEALIRGKPEEKP
ncbi:MAG: MlaD family protein [Betaproteobacteria bacterium]